jgi:hypothetical protein
MANTDFVNSNVVQGAYGASWILSMENADLIRAGFYPKVFKQYGRLYGMHDLIMGAGNELSLPAQNQKVVEKYAPKWPVKIVGAIDVGAEGGAISFQIASTSLVGNKHNARVNFSVKIPAKYMPTGYRKDGVYTITALSTTTITNDTITARPLLADGTSLTAAQIAYEVPAGTYLDVTGYSSFARGTDQPEGTKDFPVTREYTGGFIKETKSFDGGVLAHEGVVQEYNGVNYLISDASMEAEFSLKDQIEDAMIFGEPNDNALLVASATNSGDSGALRSTRGLVSWLDDAGQNVYYSDTPTLTILDDIQSALLTQGVYTATATIFCSPKFYRDLQKEAKDHIRDYSGGSDFLDSAKKTLGINIQTIVWGGMTFFLHVVAALGKPAGAGLTISDELQYAAGTMAFCIPDSQVTVNEWGQEANVTIPNLWLGYINYNGENRKRMIGRYKGMNGIFGGLDVATGVDGYKLFWGSEFMLGGAEWNKMIMIRKLITH